jgi:hypothetical protein
MRKIGLAGQRFGLLNVISQSKHIGRRIAWLCRCDCGTELIVAANNLSSGHTRSCGCVRKGVNKRHGMSETAEYRSWCKMKARCYDRNDKRYQNYGGRGIAVCSRWRNSFENFFEDMGPRPEGYSLERIDNDGIYEPSNCIWVPIENQSRNRSTVRWIEFKGKRMSIADWSREMDIGFATLRFRLDHGWPVHLALTTPAQTGNNQSTRQALGIRL